MIMAAFTFRKEERLKSKKQIDQLFASGRSFFIYPFKVFWLYSDDKQPLPARVLISVSRRNIKKAVQRNRIKRLVREAYRHQKHELYHYLDGHGRHLTLAIIYTAQEMMTLDDVSRKINRVLSRLMKELNGS